MTATGMNRAALALAAPATATDMTATGMKCAVPTAAGYGAGQLAAEAASHLASDQARK